MSARVGVQSTALARARSLLGRASGVPGRRGLLAAEALAILDDTSPPYPPLLLPEAPAGFEDDVATAQQALMAAAVVARDVAEAGRIAEASCRLAAASGR